MSDPHEGNRPWYHGVTRYQWLVLLIASLGWIFDVFEGQIFVASMAEAMPSLVPPDTSAATIARLNSFTLAAFLLGGAVGGVAFGVLSDRIGRRRTMVLTIVMYSAFTCLSAFSQQWWHLAGYRFLVAMGVGGEWAVATALVAEVFPQRARAWSLGIFHASSVFGTYLAVAAGWLIIANPVLQSEQHPSLPWRLGFLVGVLPALLIIWIRRNVREPDNWQQARTVATQDVRKKLGSLPELFSPALWRHTVIGVSLAAVGLATFWGVHVYGKDLLRQAKEAEYLSALPDDATAEQRTELLEANFSHIKRWEMTGMFLVTTGGGLGLVSFGPLCERIGRRGAFLAFHLAAVVGTLVVFRAIEGTTALLIALPVFGFVTLGMHAGYAIYFPELFPTRLRGTGGGFCFNMGRILAAPVLYLRGILREEPSLGGFGLSLADTASLLALLFLMAAALLPFAPETRDKPLPE